MRLLSSDGLLLRWHPGLSFRRGQPAMQVSSRLAFHIGASKVARSATCTHVQPVGCLKETRQRTDGCVLLPQTAQQEALAELLLLASTDILVGTARSSYSATAHWLGRNYWVEVAPQSIIEC